MGASFRNTDEILELAGCDLLTIAPKLLEELQRADGPVPRKLSTEIATASPIQKIDMDEKTFRWQLCNDPMASQKLDEGIRNFSTDIIKLESLLSSRI